VPPGPPPVPPPPRAPPPPAPPPREAVPCPGERGSQRRNHKIALGDGALSDVNDAALKEEARYQLVKLGELIRKYPDANITIVGHADKTPHKDGPRGNLTISEIKTGRGYYPGEQNKKEEQAIGVIPIDSLFSPVRLVKYSVEATRVGQITDYDKLILETWTDGRITPDDALKQSASILKHHLDVFDRVSEETYEFENQQSEVSEEQNKLRKLLNMSVNEIELSVRAANCLNNANITTVGELAMKPEQQNPKNRNFGKTSLNEIKDKIEALGLQLAIEYAERLLETTNDA